MRNPALVEEMKTYKGRDEVPQDFDAFWDGEIDKVSVLQDYQLEERDFHIPNVKCYELTFKGTRDGLVYARVVLPKSEEKVPVVFHFHGYMGRCWDWTDMLAFTVAGYGVVSMDVRGQSGYSQDGLRSPLGNTVKGQIIRGAVEGKEELFYKDVYLDIYQLIEKYKDEYSLIGLDVNRVDPSKEIVLVPYWITSGNFVNISDFYLVGKMNESLFIDYVDFDLGYRFKKAHLKIGYLSGYCITHTIGNPIPIHVLNKTFYALNHSPIRYYYRYRNAYYLYHYVDKEFFKKEYCREMFGSLIKMFIFEKNRNEKIKMIKKGLSDAKKRRLGKFNA